METFQPFWGYRSTTWAGYFLSVWTERALRSRLEPMKKVARMLRSHEDLLMNWFKAKSEISSGAVEGLNNRIRVVTRRSYGFRSYKAMEIALYHKLARLPEPNESAHNFFRPNSLLTYFGIFLGPFLFAVLSSKASGEALQLSLLFTLLLPMGLGYLWGPPPNQLLIVISYHARPAISPTAVVGWHYWLAAV
jgi:hypothetical protein